MMKLRILSGRHRGAEVELGAHALVIGSGPQADVVLSDASVAPEHARLTSSGGVFSIEPLGEAPLKLGAQIRSAAFTWRAGELARLGDVELLLLHDRLEEADPRSEPAGDDAAGAVSEPASADAPAAVDLPSLAAPSAPRSALASALAPMGCLLLAAVAAAWLAFDPPGRAVAAVVPAVRALPPSTESVRAQLVAAGFSFVQVSRDYRGEWVLAGVFADQAQAEAARRWSATHLPNARLSLLTGGELAAKAAADVDDPGLAIAFVGGNRIAVSGVPQRAATRSTIVRFQSEWAGVVEIRPDLAYLQSADQQTTPSKRKALPMKFAMLNAGPTAYIESGDGARFFVGSSLPDGSVVKSIDADRVVVEAAGKSIEYRFSN